MISALATLAVVQTLTSPTDTVKSAVRAISDSKWDAFAKCVEGAKPTAAMKQILDKQIGAKNFSIAQISETTTGSSSKVALKVSDGSKTYSDNVILKKIGAAWKIIPTQTVEPNVGPVNGLAYLMAFATEKDFQVAKKAAQRTVALSSAKQLATSLMIFALDHDDKLPTTANWVQKVGPYTKNRDLFTPPGYTKNAWSLNPAVSGKKLDDKKQVVLIYLGKNKVLDFAYEGKAVVAFTDGSAKFVTKEEAKKLRWN